MNVVGVVVSDRGDKYLPGCWESIRKHVPRQNRRWHVVDDSKHELGMAGAVRAAWSWALDQDCDYLFHVEEDFRFTETVPLEQMRWILRANPDLAQVVLKRQPWSEEEFAACGIIEAHPDDYVQRCDQTTGLRWLEHERIFSLNPCLIPRRTLELGWPDGNEAEFTRMCLDKGWRFAFYGDRRDEPRVTHVGYERGEGWRL